MKSLLFALALLGCSLCAHAAIINESEPNDTPATSNPLGSVSYGDGVTASIVPVGDIDWFSFQPTFTSGYVNLTTPLTISFYTPGPTLVNSVTGSSMQLSSLTPSATYFLRLNVPGNNTLVPLYTATFDSTPAPEPSSLTLVAFGGIALLRRRRRARPNSDKPEVECLAASAEWPRF